MSGDPLHVGHGLRVEALRERASGLQALRGQLQRELASRRQEVDQLTSKLDKLTKVGELFRSLMDLMVMDHVKSIEDVITEGLQTIFYDQDLTFEAEVSTRYNKLAIDFFIRQDNQRASIRAHPLEAFGGGPASIASLILRVLAMRRLKKWPILALDESLVAVSAEYVDQTGRFLRELADKAGISILLVTHNTSFLDHAVVGYKGSEVTTDAGDRHLCLQREVRHAH
jgi:ABC-type dipeptide/oligopeptide/nickel transport system ATPase component